jgi:hypothetical protein
LESSQWIILIALLRRLLIIFAPQIKNVGELHLHLVLLLLHLLLLLFLLLLLIIDLGLQTVNVANDLVGHVRLGLREKGLDLLLWLILLRLVCFTTEVHIVVISWTCCAQGLLDRV